MTAQEFTDNWIKENSLPIHTSTRLLEKTIAKIVEEYHQQQVKSVDLDDVTESVCDNCGKPIEQHSNDTQLCPDRFAHFEQTDR